MCQAKIHGSQYHQPPIILWGSANRLRRSDGYPQSILRRRGNCAAAFASDSERYHRTNSHLPASKVQNQPLIQIVTD
jgi:hypothetical protein